MAKVNKRIFVFLGSPGGAEPVVTVRLRGEAAHGHATSIPGAFPSRYGLGRAGWVSIPLGKDAPVAELLCDWVEECYRVIAPKRRVAESHQS